MLRYLLLILFCCQGVVKGEIVDVLNYDRKIVAIERRAGDRSVFDIHLDDQSQYIWSTDAAQESLISDWEVGDKVKLWANLNTVALYTLRNISKNLGYVLNVGLEPKAKKHLLQITEIVDNTGIFIWDILVKLSDGTEWRTNWSDNNTVLRRWKPGNRVMITSVLDESKKAVLNNVDNNQIRRIYMRLMTNQTIVTAEK
ncbi:MAG: hypothetical protein KDK65_00735 [Chlamydiia bacterium]|nr:hypothetical protein [Chlamydiia bacterium]